MTIFSLASLDGDWQPNDLCWFVRDGNALVNEDDVDFMLQAVMKTDFGDADVDGDVDFADFLALSRNFGQEGGWADGDFDGDGVVGFSDFTVLAGNFGG